MSCGICAIIPFYWAYYLFSILVILSQAAATRHVVTILLFTAAYGLLTVGWARALYLLWLRASKFPGYLVVSQFEYEAPCRRSRLVSRS